MRCTTLTRLARLPQACDGVEGLRYFGLQAACRLGLQRSVLALGTSAVVIARPQRIAARGDGFAPAAGGATEKAGWGADGHGWFYASFLQNEIFIELKKISYKSF